MTLAIARSHPSSHALHPSDLLLKTIPQLARFAFYLALLSRSLSLPLSINCHKCALVSAQFAFLARLYRFLCSFLCVCVCVLSRLENGSPIVFGVDAPFGSGSLRFICLLTFLFKIYLIFPLAPSVCLCLCCSRIKSKMQHAAKQSEQGAARVRIVPRAGITSIES